jgi:hypothetical protein
MPQGLGRVVLTANSMAGHHDHISYVWSEVAMVCCKVACLQVHAPVPCVQQ